MDEYRTALDRVRSPFKLAEISGPPAEAVHFSVAHTKDWLSTIRRENKRFVTPGHPFSLI
jgi:hypothetical protein